MVSEEAVMVIFKILSQLAGWTDQLLMLIN